ncbi:MFS family permease [Arthrobacter sp. UYNi723]
MTRILDLSTGEMGAVLLIGAAGSVVALPLSGRTVSHVGTANTVRTGGMVAAAGGIIISVALLLASVPLTALGLFCFGAGIGLWDVAQNIEGAEVERQLARTVMPQFHAAFSGGAFVGALLGTGLSGLNIGLPMQLMGVAAVVIALVLVATRYYLPEHPHSPPKPAGRTKPRGPNAWKEGRTLLVGLVVLGAALTSGTANDWLAKATVDGMHTTEASGALMYAAFAASMTTFRFVGGRFIDRFGRVPVLYASLGAALAGLLLFVLGPNVWLAGLGAVFWGAGAALGFPTGISAAADDPVRAASRVSVVSTIGYAAYVAGPPLLGFLGDHFTIRYALLAIGIVVIASLLTTHAARPLSPNGLHLTADNRLIDAVAGDLPEDVALIKPMQQQHID